MSKALVAREPSGPIEWQAAADAAQLLLTMAACRDFGLLTRSIAIDAERCSHLLTQAAQQGITPRPGPDANASLLTSIRFPELEQAIREKREWKKLGSGAVSLPVTVQRIAGVISDARVVVQFRGQPSNRVLAQVRVNESVIQVHLPSIDGWFVIDLEKLVTDISVVAGVEEM